MSRKDTKQDSRKQGRVTLRDVAHAVGVSAMTVSNVVNGRLAIVNKETRKRVQRALAELNYRPHVAARGLRLSIKSSVGVLIISEVHSHISDPLVLQTIIGLSDRLQQDGFALVMQAIHPDDLKSSSIVRNHATDGMTLILEGSPARRHQSLELMCGLGHPIVLFQDTIGGAKPDLCIIRQDDFRGARKLGTRVLRRGARSIVMLVPSVMSAGFEERERGFRAVFTASEDSGMRFSVVRCGDASITSAQNALANHIRRFGVPDAVLGGNDQLGLAAIRFLTGLGKRIPDDVLVTGFNGFEIHQFSIPTLTTVQSPAYKMGTCAAAALLHRLNTGRFQQREVMFPVRMLPGDSA